MHENHTLCAACAGRCCKQLPGAALPTDFELPTTHKLFTALVDGRWTLDWWEGDPRPGKAELDQAYFVRPAILGYEGELYHPAWFGVCTFLQPNGCELLADARPWGCRILEPGNPCILHSEFSTCKQAAAIAWLFYAAELERVAIAVQNLKEPI